MPRERRRPGRPAHGGMKRPERVLVAAFGAVLFAIGAWALVAGVAPPAWRYLGGLAFCAAGVDALHGAVTGRRPWITRIGPLP